MDRRWLPAVAPRAGGWLLTELLFFALPAGWVLRRARAASAAAGFSRASLPGIGLSVVLGLVVMAVAVGKGAVIRQALGVPRRRRSG
ncbi:MAG: hypothetical protein M5U12_35265 [Verrucomicrobia bacterium]|nr:hypothetical protein [Verrucomicrobiota bacterium]